MNKNNMTRRDWIKGSIIAVAAIPLLRGLLGGRFVTPVSAADLPDLNPASNPTAQALGYVADAKKVDKKKYPAYKADASCKNCTLFTQDAKSPQKGACALFPGVRVSSAGWCASWVKKA